MDENRIVTHSSTPKTELKSPVKKFKIIVIGDADVGKTTLTYRFCEGEFLAKPQATIGVDYRTRSLEIDGEPIVLQIWDTAGQERFRQTMVNYYYRNVDAIILVYDVTNVASFHNLKRWMDEAAVYCLSDVPMILVGNKCDQTLAVPTNEAQKFADSHNMPLFETSSRLDSQCDNVEPIFLTLAHKLKNHRRYLPLTDTKSTIKVTAKVVNDTTQNSSCGCWPF